MKFPYGISDFKKIITQGMATINYYEKELLI